jgi:hypothetical protein
MRSYEIRIAEENRHTIIEVMHLNDNAAVRSARKMAGRNRFEVWRDLDCVYDGTAAKASVPNAPL